MLVTRTIAAVAATITIAVGLAAPAAAKDDTPPPVAVDDTVSLYPGQSRTIDVLANDSSPSGQELQLCRFPEPDFDDEGYPDVFAYPLGEGGRIEVMAFAFGPKDTTIEYFVCDETHVVRATLHVDIRDIAPIEVSKTGRPGQLRVTNANEAKIVFLWGHRGASRPAGRVVVPGGATELVRVTSKGIVWIARIGRGGIADHGWVKGIKQPR